MDREYSSRDPSQESRLPDTSSGVVFTRGEQGKEFYDPELIVMFTKWIKKFFSKDSVIEVDLSINDPEFGLIACKHLETLMKVRG